MISTILANLYAFALSMPLNMIIIILICIFMKVVLKRSIMDCIRVIIGYLLVGVILALFGITMPDFATIGNWIAGFFNGVFHKVW